MDSDAARFVNHQRYMKLLQKETNEEEARLEYEGVFAAQSGWAKDHCWLVVAM